MKRALFTILLMILTLSTTTFAKEHYVLKGKVVDATNNKALPGAIVTLDGTTTGATVGKDGDFSLLIHRKYRPEGTITIFYIGFETQTINLNGNKEELYIQLKPSAMAMEEIEVFGQRHTQPDKLDYITRMPLRPSEQIQSISVISEQLIKQQGNLQLADAAKNVVGISTFSTFGGASESLTVRGFRGIPILKNGVRIHSDFRGGGTLTEMQGVESVQVIKGSASITQGIGNDLASAGGVLNIATKTPKFINQGEVNLRSGSWGLFRPTFDVQSVVNSKGNLAVRLTGAYERSDSYRKYVSKNRVYINPSLAWKLDSKTDLVVEMDYMHDSRTPDRGTINLSAMDENTLYDMPHSKFLGFKDDRLYTNQTNFSMRFTRKISDKLTFRIAVAGSGLDTDNTGMSYRQSKDDYKQLTRSLSRSQRNDKNRLLQVDFIGRDVMTWGIKHTFQAGIDFRYNKLTENSFNSIKIDDIDIFSDFTNDLVLPENENITPNERTISKSYSYGLLAQDVITFAPFVKAVLGVRYSYQDSNGNIHNFGNNSKSRSISHVDGDAFNPMAGIIFTPFKAFHIFGSYTNTTDLRSANSLMEDGTPLGKSVVDQFEAGIKSEWLDGRLRANVTLFHVENSNLAYLIYDEDGVSTQRYGKAGDLRRQGVEVEVTGRILRNLQAILGYAYLNAEYRNSEAYVHGSAPMNVPKHTANGWLYYTLEQGTLKGLSAGVGFHYVGKRPVNDYTKKYTHVGTEAGIKPFDMKAYTTVNATLAYNCKRFGASLVFNNIFDKLGYSSYARGGYINPIDPFNISASLTYRF